MTTFDFGHNCAVCNMYVPRGVIHACGGLSPAGAFPQPGTASIPCAPISPAPIPWTTYFTDPRIDEMSDRLERVEVRLAALEINIENAAASELSDYERAMLRNEVRLLTDTLRDAVERRGKILELLGDELIDILGEPVTVDDGLEPIALDFDSREGAHDRD